MRDHEEFDLILFNVCRILSNVFKSFFRSEQHFFRIDFRKFEVFIEESKKQNCVCLWFIEVIFSCRKRLFDMGICPPLTC